MLDVLKFDITADAKTARAFAVLKGQLGDVKGALAGIHDRATRAGRAMRNIGLGATAAVTAPLVLLGKQAVQLADIQMKAEAAVTQAIASTGAAAGLSADELFRMASGLQAVTTYGDEDILQNVTAPLLTFTKIAGPEFERAQTAILDMSTLLQMDLKSAAVQVGKALNDPIGGVTALSRAGVQFTEEQKAMIASLVETGEVAAAQGIILEELETQFQGQAAAAARTPLGQWKQLSNAIGDVKEQLGAEIVPFLEPLVAKVKEAVAAFSKLDPEVKQQIVIFGGLAAAAGPVLAVIGTVTLGLTGLATAFASLSALVLANPITAVLFGIAVAALAIWQNWDRLGSWFAGLWERIKAGAASGWSAIKETISGYAPQWLKDMWDGLAGWFGIMWSAVELGAGIAWEQIKALLTGKFGPDQILAAWSQIAEWFSQRWSEVVGVFQQAWEMIAAEVGSWPGRMERFGEDMVAGLLRGIVRRIPGTEAVMDDIYESTATKLEELYGIRSPSRVFAGIGENLMAGLGLGIEQNAGQVVDQMRRVVEQTEKAARGSGQLSSMFASTFSAIARGAETAESALNRLLGRLADMAMNKLFTSLFDNLFEATGLDALFSADGNVFSGGRVQAFASGGVVSRATAFPLRGGLGVMGEAGPEAIMPLARGPGGKLGVHATGSAAAQPAVVNVINRTEPGLQVETRESTVNGQRQIENFITRVVSQGLQPGGPIGRVLKESYGLGPAMR